MAKKVIVVVGGAGFIGSNLCNALLKDENKIICVDNLSTGSERNIKTLLLNNKLTFINHDVSESNFEQIFRTKRIDEIYHLASPASVTYITDHPIQAAIANSLGTRNLLELAHVKRAKILFASSSEAYGDPKEHPQKESYWGNVNPVGVRSGYDEGKRFGEAFCMAYYRQKSLDVKIVRIFNTYGVNSSIEDSRVVPQFIRQALMGDDITVHGDGTQTRSLCYVGDMVAGLIKCMEGGEVGPINLGNPEEIKIIDLAKKILDMTNSKSKITFVQRPKDDPSVRRPDITKAQDKLSWEPTVSLEDGLQLTISYFKSIIA